MIKKMRFSYVNLTRSGFELCHVHLRSSHPNEYESRLKTWPSFTTALKTNEFNEFAITFVEIGDRVELEKLIEVSYFWGDIFFGETVTFVGL